MRMFLIINWLPNIRISLFIKCVKSAIQNAAFKAKLALEAVKGEKTISQLSTDHGIHGNQIRQWKKKLLDNLPNIFIEKKNIKNGEELISELYRQIGQLKVELDLLRKQYEKLL